MWYRSEKKLYDYIVYGVPSFVSVKSALQADYVERGMEPARYHHNMQLLYTHCRECDKVYR